jgi:hypothetical protein
MIDRHGVIDLSVYLKDFCEQEDAEFYAALAEALSQEDTLIKQEEKNDIQAP